MKNICFLNGDMSRSGGTERVTAIIANELSKLKEKFNVHILSTVNKSGNTFFSLNEDIKISRVLAEDNINFKKQYFKIVKGIRSYVQENNIDVLIDVDVISDIFSIPALSFTNTKLISWEHFNFYEANNSSLRKLSRRLAGRFSDYIITLTEQDKENYIKNIRINKNIDFIYNPIEKAPKDSCNIEAKQIISVGRLTYQKGFDMLCDIAKEVLKNNEDWTWVILGEGEDRPILEEKINKYNLNNRLMLKGNVSNVEDYYKNSSIYVMTSRFEGLPMTLLEAKSYKLPIVSFNCLTGPSDIVTDDVNGYLVEENDIRILSDKVNKLINNKVKRMEFRDNAIKDINKFQLQAVVEKWTNLLEKI